MRKFISKGFKMNHKAKILTFFGLIACFKLLGQNVEPKRFDYPYDVQVFDLPKSSNGIAYRIYIRKPLREPIEGQKSSAIYFLDPLKLFVPAAAMSYNYEYFNYIPSSYFIGIGYQNEANGRVKEKNRTRDYTPTSFTPPNDKHYLASNPVDYEGSGGTDQFLKVLEEEMIPFVESRFPVNKNDRVLVGNSMSGLAVVHTLLTKPSLFNRYVIVSPSIWWDDWLYERPDRYVMKQASKITKEIYTKETKVYFAVGEAEERLGLVTDVYVLSNKLRMMQIPNLKIHLEVLVDEQHEGVFPSGFMKGIVGVYADERNRKASSTNVKWK